MVYNSLCFEVNLISILLAIFHVCLADIFVSSFILCVLALSDFGINYIGNENKIKQMGLHWMKKIFKVGWSCWLHMMCFNILEEFVKDRYELDINCSLNIWWKSQEKPFWGRCFNTVLIPLLQSIQISGGVGFGLHSVLLWGHSHCLESHLVLRIKFSFLGDKVCFPAIWTHSSAFPFIFFISSWFSLGLVCF